MSSYINLTYCRELAEDLRRHMDDPAQARMAAQSALQQMQGQTCQKEIEALQRAERDLAALEADISSLHRTLLAVADCYEQTERSVTQTLLSELPVPDLFEAGGSAAAQAAAQQSEAVHIPGAVSRTLPKIPETLRHAVDRLAQQRPERWMQAVPFSSSFQIQGNEVAEDWLVRNMLEEINGSISDEERI